MYDSFSVDVKVKVVPCSWNVRGDMVQRHCIPVKNDDIVEGDKTFYVYFERTADLDGDKLY